MEARAPEFVVRALAEWAWYAGVVTKQIESSVATGDVAGLEYQTRRLIAYTRAIAGGVRDIRAQIGTEGVAA